MSLFSQLFAHRWGPEDYFTEIAAHLLRETDGLLLDWLDYLELVETGEYIDFDISTQAVYDEGRPDILIELFTENSDDLIFIESKLGSQEGNKQLRRYARELSKNPHARERFLLYITRDYDPKDKQSILKGLPPESVIFRQLRWSDFYRFLKLARQDDRLIDEVCAYMEEKRMSQSNQFTPTDILAMSKLPQIIALMNQTLYGEVSERFEEVVGNVSGRDRTRSQLRHSRFTLVGRLFNRGACVMGFWFKESAYPTVGISVEMHPNSPNQDDVLAMMREISSEMEWNGYKLNQPRKWPRFRVEKPLNELTAGDDHVKAVKDYFFERLDEVVEIKKRYPHIRWKVVGISGSDLDEEE